MTVLAITDHSFSQPYILLSAEVPTDPGYFQERIAAARQQLIETWTNRSAHLLPTFRHTDVVGSMLLARTLLGPQSSSDKRFLVLFSDMRQDTVELDLTRPSLPSSSDILSKLQYNGEIPDLLGVNVYVLGVDASGWTVTRWQHLRQFWCAYFVRSGARELEYSILRQPPWFDRQMTDPQGCSNPPQ